MVQGFLSTTEGVVFKWAKKGSAAAAPWLICKKEGKQFRQVSIVCLPRAVCSVPLDLPNCI